MKAAAVLAGVALAVSLSSTYAAETNRQAGAANILFILTDDQGWSQLSKEMHPGIPDSRSVYLHTPDLERSIMV
jgi:hypothetical protein